VSVEGYIGRYKLQKVPGSKMSLLPTGMSASTDETEGGSDWQIQAFHALPRADSSLVLGDESCILMVERDAAGFYTLSRQVRENTGFGDYETVWTVLATGPKDVVLRAIPNAHFA
jgi:hypothetical protein